MDRAELEAMLPRMQKAAADAIRAQLDGEVVAAAKRRNKYHAARAQVDGLWFDSRREARRYMALKALRQAGQVLWFARQARFALPGPAEYVCDFVVAWADGRVTVEDAKGVRTKIYRLKKRQVESLYRVKIEEC